MLPVERAIEAFVRGFAFTRCFTHPYEVSKCSAIWRMRDAPRTSGDYRTEEFVAAGVEVDDVLATIRSVKPGRYCVCHVLPKGEPDTKLRANYKAAGFRLLRREPLMVCTVANSPKLTAPLPVKRVLTADLAEAVKAGAGGRQILPCHLVDDAPLRLYAALDDGRPVGWVRSIAAGAGIAWVSNMFVMDEYRRRGIGGSLMSAMLADDATRGVTSSVLLASSAGSMLYRTLGYEQIGLLHLFTPIKG